MENEDRQPWLLIGIAALGLLLGVLALVVAFNAKSTSDDAAEQAAVSRVDAKLTRLIDRLGVDEEGVSGKERSLQESTDRETRKSSEATAGLAARIAKLERQVSSLDTSSQQYKVLTKKVDSMETRLGEAEAEIKALNQRVTKLSRRVDAADGGQAAP